VTMASRRSKRAKIAATNGAEALLIPSPPPLPLPSSSPLLDEDVTGLIVAFLDTKSCCTAAGVSRAFRDALIPRQRAVAIKDFQSYERQMGFLGVTFFSGRDSNLMTNDVLRELGEDHTSFRRLSGVDLSGCQQVNVNGVRRLVKGLGPRLERFVMNRTRSLSKDMRVTDAIIKVVASAPNLQSLDLFLPSKCKDTALQPLEGHESLRELALSMDIITPFHLPRSLPQLERLTIKTCGWSRFDYGELSRVEYPNLKELIVHYETIGFKFELPEALNARVLSEMASRAPHFNMATVHMMGYTLPKGQSRSMLTTRDFVIDVVRSNYE
jgi:hypothetical protein